MKALNRILKTVKIPFKFIYRIGSSPIKFVYHKQRKWVEILAPLNVKVVSIKLYRTSKKVIITIVFILSTINSSGVESQKINEQSSVFPAKMPIERVVGMAYGGAVGHPWSPKTKYESKSSSSKSSSSENGNLRSGRRLLSTSGSDSRSNRGQPKSNFDYTKLSPSLNDGTPKSGKGLRIRSIATEDENGEIRTVHYDKNGPVIDGPADSEFLNDGNSNSTNPDIEDKIKNQDIQNQNSGLTKERKNLKIVEDERLTPEGDVVSPSKLTPTGRSLVRRTKDRRAASLLQSRYEDKDENFLPAYSVRQIGKKDKHTLQVLERLGKNVTKYTQLTENEKLQVDISIVESLLAHPDTEIHMNVIGQGREPIAMVLNRGKGDYPIPNHIGTFERRPEICHYNSYISNYPAKDSQIERFDRGTNTSTTYEDLIGDSHTNIGPIFGRSVVTDDSAPTISSTVNDVDPEL